MVAKVAFLILLGVALASASFDDRLVFESDLETKGNQGVGILAAANRIKDKSIKVIAAVLDGLRRIESVSHLRDHVRSIANKMLKIASAFRDIIVKLITELRVDTSKVKEIAETQESIMNEIRMVAMQTFLIVKKVVPEVTGQVKQIVAQ